MKELQFWLGLGAIGAMSVLVASPAKAQNAEVRAVKLNPTPSGLEVILETGSGRSLQTFSASSGRVFIADIITTRLDLPGGKDFRADNPAPGIASVTVTPLDANSIRVKVVSTAGVPTAQVVTRSQGLVLSLNTAPGTTAVRPAPVPPGTAPSEPGTQLRPTPVPSSEPGAEPSTQPRPTQPTLPTLEPDAQGTPTQPTRPSGEVGTQVRPVPPSVSPREPGTSRDSVNPTVPRPQTPANEPTEIIVTGDPEAYLIPEASAATRIDAPIRDIPQSIQVVPERVVEDQAATRVVDVLRNVSGISRSGSSQSYFSDVINIRGFGIGRGYNINGTRTNFGGAQINLETANIERLEVLKGPASVLYGQGEPGGIINVTTKQPLSEPFYGAEITIGSYNFYRPSIDLSGPLNADRTILYRLTAAYESAGSFIDYVDTERFFISPVVSFQLGRNTTIALESQFLRNSTPDYPGLPAVGTVLSNPLGRVPISRFVGDPNIDPTVRNHLVFGYRFEHKFSENWSARNIFRSEALIYEDYYYDATLQPDNRTVNRTAFRGDSLAQNYSLQTDIIGKVQTGSVSQQFLFGVDLRRVNFDIQAFDAPIPSIDLFNPIYRIPRPDFSNKNFDAFLEQNILGIYFQDLISIGERIKLLLGGRYDVVEETFINRSSDQNFFQDDSKFSPRVGIVYQPIDPVSLYFNYSRSFAPSEFGARNADGTPFEPTTGQQFEIGVKTEFAQGRASANLALYQITKQNVVTPDPERAGFSIQVGEQRSRGVELDVVGEILPGFNIIATYAFTDAEITEDNGGNEGNRPYNVPAQSGSLWATYTVQSGGLRGLGFGAGIFFVGDREGNDANEFELPSYSRTDAVLYYRRNNLRAALNFKNIFNVRYFEGTNGNINQVFPGAPFTVQGTLAIEF